MGGSNDLFDRLVKLGGIFQKIFGDKLFSGLVYDKEFEYNKRMLKQVYGYTELDDIMGKEVDKDNFKMMSKFIFKIQEKKNGDN